LTLWRDNSAGLFQVATACASFAVRKGIGTPRSYRSRVVFVLAVGFATLSLNAAAASAAPPTVTINPTVTPEYTTAQVSGTVDPADEETYYSFEYSADPATEGWSFFAYEGPIAAGAGTQNVSAELTGLKPGTEYQLRIAALNFEESIEYFSAEPNPTFTTKAVAAPTVSLTAPTDVTAKTAAVHAQINPNAPEPAPASPTVEAAFNVYWRFECTPGCSGAGFNGEGNVPADDVAHPVTGELFGLQPGRTYEVSLHTENIAGSHLTTSTETFSTPPAAPVVERAFARSVEGTAAEIGAKINPEGAQTSYHFQYVTLAEFEAHGFSGARETPVTPLGTGNADLTALAQITGLSPGVTYVYRAMASNAVETVSGAEAELHTPAPAPPSSGGGCPNESLRVGPSALLPDCRAYEQVTPTEKSNQDGVFANGFEFFIPQVAADGDQAAYFSFGAFSGSEAPNPFYLAKRGTANWGSEGMIPPQGAGHGLVLATACLPQYSAYSPDLARGVLEEGFGLFSGSCAKDEPPLVPGEPRGVQNLFLRDNTTGTYQLINRPPEGVTPADALFQGGSPDLRHVVFSEPAPLTPDAAGGPMLYEWSAGDLSLVGLIPAPGATSCSGSACIAAEGAELGGSGVEPVALVDRAVSEDGSRVFFNADGNLYLRTGDTTREVDASQGPGPSGGGDFRTASEDGNSVLFTDPNQLTVGSSPSGDDLYRYEVGSGRLTDLTPDATDSRGAAVQGVLGASDDASYVYFVANGVLTTAPSSERKVASEGSCVGEFNTEPCNLYLWHDGATTFIGKTVGIDRNNWNGSSATRATPDGTELAFGSVESLTGYDNVDQITGKLDSEMYLYEAVTNSLRCISCNSRGARPMGESRISATKVLERNVEPGGRFPTNNFSLSRNLSQDGKRLFFESDEALTPADTDGKRDVYEFELVGSGTCTSSTGAYVTAAGGCIYLISTGEGQGASYFYEAGANGDDVFFTTRDQLVGQDADGFVDLYDARVEGGLAAQNPPASPLPCSGDGCKGSSTAAPAGQGPGSSSFNGPGNQKKASKPSCKRSKGKRHRCAKKHHKSHNHKKHHKQPKHHKHHKQHRRAK
jgi:hypothetical protein